MNRHEFQPLTDKVSFPLSNSNKKQTGEARLSVKCTLTNVTPSGEDPYKYLLVDLDGSTVNSGINMIADDNDRRGYFTEKIRYRVWLQEKNHPVDFQTALSNFVRLKESPQDSNLTGSITSGITISADGTVGVFGDTPTANVGGGIAFSNSHTHVIQDFTFLNQSQGNVLNQVMVMSCLQDGTEYNASSTGAKKFETMLSQPMPSLTDPLPDAVFRELPSLAKDNIPIIGQGLWMTQSGAAYKLKKVYLCIDLQIDFQLVNMKGLNSFGDFLKKAGMAVFDSSTITKYFFDLATQGGMFTTSKTASFVHEIDLTKADT